MFRWLRESVRTLRTHPVRALLVLAGLILLGRGALAGAAHLGASRHFQLAQEALERGDLDLAQTHLDACRQVWDDRADVHLLAAQTACRRDDFDHADACLSIAERLTPAAETVRLERELLIAQQGEPGAMRGRLETLAHRKPELNGPILEALAKGYANVYAKSDAWQCSNLLVKFKPDDARAYLTRGKANDRLERYGAALADYRRALELSPGLDEARLRLGQLLYRLGKSCEALPHFECLRQRGVQNSEILLGLARCRIDLAELDQARQLLTLLLEEEPTHAEALLERGRLEFHAGQAASAETWLRRAAAVAPWDRDMQRALLLCLHAQGKQTDGCTARLHEIDAKLRQLHALVDKTKGERGDAPLRSEIAEILRGLGRTDDALSYYHAALGHDAGFAPAHAALAEHWQRAGQAYRAARHRLAKKGANSPP